ncbi:MAG: T9SS C-terminal target domain-containing protein [Flavobacteriales bacterium]|nr:T9SS C-terminal target domain-containing protein [Flavobacteriales bacterium]
MKSKLPLLLALVIVSLSNNVTAQDAAFLQSGKLEHMAGVTLPTTRPKAASCAPATALRDLEWNNIDALIETGGSLWQDRANGRSHYYAPKSGVNSVLFAGSLWLGGVSPDQQLKLAALQYRYSGSDYWPGPLTTDGTAETTSSSCLSWDKFSVSLRTDAAMHRAYFECQNDPNCDLSDLLPNGYVIPSYFMDYPAHGNLAAGQDFYIAPFYDFDDNGIYDPTKGDYPWYDIDKSVNCRKRKSDDPVPLYGDQTLFWVFNDKGNIHTESGGQAIGMEIRAQAFAFSTNDEVNNMTFYNYVLINQGTQKLQDTYFGTWIDCDIGGHVDDYVGCDVQRGLGYGYNGNSYDGPSALSFGYGENPPAVGVDFFEGPYQDKDSMDNPLTDDINIAFEQKGIPYKGIGIGYGDGIVDNERFGMRKFLYHISGTGTNGPPTQASHYYNYLRGYWKNNQRMTYGGNALTVGTGTDPSIPADYMFPGDTDPLRFGTYGIDVAPWTEVSSDNLPGDRRFMQSAGPFTLEPGDYNNITVGVVYARATSGDPFASVELLRQADDKAQALFDNCFELISGPDAPDVEICELENELILMWTNENSFNSNYHELYSTIDPTIPEVDADGNTYSIEERSYHFQGYMIYQLADENVSITELADVNLARLIGQCDVEDEVGTIINYERDDDTGIIAGALKVDGANEGIYHSLRITEDAFALGDKTLINHKTYYFMVIAYGYNNYRDYDISTNSGQDEAFLASRKGSFGTIRPVSGIPHKVLPQADGTYTHSSYGQELALKQYEGIGNGDHWIAMDETSELEIVAQNTIEDIQYNAGASPVKVKVVDPLRVPAADFELKLAPDNQGLVSDSAFWQLHNLTTDEYYNSYHAILTPYEELMIDWGLSVYWKQVMSKDSTDEHFTDFIGAAIIYEDPSLAWLTGFPDDDSYGDYNWIRSGSNYKDPATGDPIEVSYNDYTDGHLLDSAATPNVFTDGKQKYESVLNGTWSPYCLVSGTEFDTEMNLWRDRIAPTIKAYTGDITNVFMPKYTNNIIGLNNVDIVLTDDKSKWTRCPVFEMQIETELSEGHVEKMQMRKHASLDKNGLASGQSGCNENEATQNGTQPEGMSWFPGYAIDVNTGERLNMAFGEDSWQISENGGDMIWNPSENMVSQNGAPIAAGQHWIYVFKNMTHLNNGEDFMPTYDAGNYVYSLRSNNGSMNTANLKKLFSACTWVGSAIRIPGTSWKSVADGLIPTKTRISLRVSKTYQKYDVTNPVLNDYTNALNYWNPVYRFSTGDLFVQTDQITALEESLPYFNVVPNPYYAFSSYEKNKLDNVVKITNVPERCVISIYDLKGTLIRQYNKSDPLTSLNWDLKNHKGIPISSGTYIIHIKVPDVGERILKWFGVMRPIDLENF